MDQQRSSVVKSANNGSTRMNTHLHGTTATLSTRKDQLSVQDGCVLLDSRVVVPSVAGQAKVT